MKSAIQTMIFRKTLVLSAEARQKAEGNSDAIIHTLMRFHAGNVSSFLLVFHLLIWSAPLQILLYGTRLYARAVCRSTPPAHSHSLQFCHLSWKSARF